MESSASYNFNNYNSYIALECVVFGENDYSGVDPQTVIKIARCCTLFHDIVFSSEKESGYWKRQVLNKFTYEIALSGTNWRKLYIEHSNNKFADECLNIIEKGTAKTELYKRLLPFIDILSYPDSNARIQYFLALCYQCGSGVPKDTKKASEYFKFSSDQGYFKSQAMVGYEYVRKGDPENMKKGIELIKLAADKGHPAAQHSLATYYEEGKGVDKDQAMADKYYTLAEKAGYALSIYRHLK